MTTKSRIKGKPKLRQKFDYPDLIRAGFSGCYPLFSSFVNKLYTSEKVFNQDIQRSMFVHSNPL